jgi:hypothetical protein
MPENREKLNPSSSFGSNTFSMSSPDTLALEEVDSFLNSDPDKVVAVKKPGEQEDEEELKKKKEEEDKKLKDKEETEEKDNKKPVPKIKAEVDANDLDFLNEDDEEGKKDEEEELDQNNKPILQRKVPDKKEDPEDESIYSVLTKDLIGLGVFTPDEDAEGNEIPLKVATAEDFQKQFQSEVRKQTTFSIQKFLEQFGPEYSEMFDSVFVQGVDPYEYISRQAKIENIEGFDITNEDNQEKIVRQLLREEGRTPESIEAKIQKFKNYGDLETEATEAKSILVAKEQKDLQNITQRKQEEIQRKNKIKEDYINSINRIVSEKFKAKEFDGIPVDRKFAETTAKYLTKDAYQTPDKQLLTEFDKDVLDLNRPENNATKVKLAMLLQILKTDPTLSKLGKRAVSKESNKVFSELERKMVKTNKPVTREKEETPQYSGAW